MSKEWILNSAINRWGLQKKKMVGAVSDEIRKCSPKTVKDWENYYFKPNIGIKARTIFSFLRKYLDYIA